MKYTYKHTLHACYFSYITQALVNNLTPLLFVIFQDQFGISFEMIGRLILINFGTQIVADYFGAKYVDRIGYQKSAIAAHILCIVGLVGIAVLPRVSPSPYTGLVVSVMFYAIGAGIIDVYTSQVVQSLPGDAKASAMSLLHSFFCWGQMIVVLISTLAIKLLGNNLWFLLPIVWSIVPLYNMYRFTKVPLMSPVPEDKKIPARQLFTSKQFIIALVLMVCAGSSELNMSQWSATFAQKGLGVGQVLGDLLGPCLFAAFMGTGRAIFGISEGKISLKKGMMASSIMCMACYIVTAVVPIPIISLLGCALCGLSVSLMWPGTYSLTAENYPNGGSSMFGYMAIFGSLGGSIGPWMTGVISDWAQKSSQVVAFGQAHGFTPEQMGLKLGLFTGVVFPLILLISITFLKQKSVSDSTEKIA